MEQSERKNKCGRGLGRVTLWRSGLGFGLGQELLLFFVIIHGSLFQIVSTCPMPPPSPLNSRLIDGKIVCDEGFTLFGDTAIPKCGQDNSWTDIPICATDISLNLPTNQSSMARPSASSVDEHSSCSTTLKESSPWWKIDLLTPQLIYFLKIQFGQETSSSSDVEIRIGNSSVSQRNPLCAWEGVAKNTTYKCARPIIGQYVYVQMVGDGILSVCDYSLFSTNDPSRCHPTTKAGEIIHFNHTCYEIVLGSFDYNQSTIQCKTRGGSLMAGTYPVNLMKHKLEQTKAKLKKQLFWIGVERDNTYTSRVWRSVKNNQIIQKLHWGKDQPNNYNGLQNCIVLDGLRGWNWNDVGCNIENNYICEFGVKSCSNPDRKELSMFKVEPSYSVGTSVEYECVEGHHLKGSKYRDCLENGKWSGHAPECFYVSCGDVSKELANGVVTYPNRTDFGATIKYTCHENYTLVGFHERRCKENKEWSGEEPSCLLSTCPQPDQIINGTVSTNGLKPKSIATYRCNKGSILIGSNTATCNLGGKWNPPIKPTCLYVQCGKLPAIKHGKILTNGTEIHDHANIICDEGYWVENGDEFFVCNEEGEWKNGGRCAVITCQEPEVPLGAYIIGYDLTVNSVISYHCDPGHFLRGQASRSCLNNGEWSGSAPECTFVDCGRVPTIPYGQLSYTAHTALDSVVKYSCASQYRLRGDSQRVCSKDGHWSGSSPTCEEIRCTEPTLPSNAIISVTLNDRSAARSLITTNENTKQTFKLGSVLKFRCERGYKLIGHHIQTCIDGMWSTNTGRSSENPTCSFVDCGEPSPASNGKYRLVSNTTYLNSAVIYECDDGFKLRSKSEKMVCGEDGRWGMGMDMKTEQVDGMACDEISCPRLQSQNVIVTKNTPGGLASYSCPRGFELIGPDKRVCQENGEWSDAEPNCRATPCPSPPDIPNSRVFHMNTSTDNLHSTQVEYNCIAGFELIGNAVLTCYEASWTANPPECVVYDGKSNLPIVLGVGFGVLLVLFFIVVLLYFKKTRYKSNNTNTPETNSTRKEHPMVMFEPPRTFDPPESHYYDNPNGEHIYEDLPCERDSVVTINGVAIS